MQYDLPDDVNGDVLRRLVAEGDNLSVPRTIDFQIIFPDEKSAT
ncbi:ribonuclease E inhibitor RraB [Agrobacterium sp. AGB01]|nr:ribonuclease E inhibitor RraB [Agrobacterium sp. AGB01]